MIRKEGGGREVGEGEREEKNGCLEMEEAVPYMEPSCDNISSTHKSWRSEGKGRV